MHDALQQQLHDALGGHDPSSASSLDPYGAVIVETFEPGDDMVVAHLDASRRMGGTWERTYDKTMDAWRTSCPSLPVWEDANERGLVERAVVNGRVIVRATPDGLALLEERRPGARRNLRARSAS